MQVMNESQMFSPFLFPTFSSRLLDSRKRLFHTVPDCSCSFFTDRPQIHRRRRTARTEPTFTLRLLGKLTFNLMLPFLSGVLSSLVEISALMRCHATTNFGWYPIVGIFPSQHVSIPVSCSYLPQLLSHHKFHFISFSLISSPCFDFCASSSQLLCLSLSDSLCKSVLPWKATSSAKFCSIHDK